MQILTSEQVTEVCSRILEKVGVKPEDARLIGNYIAKTELYGVVVSGIQDLPGRVTAIQSGTVKPRAQWQFTHDSSAVALIDGSWGIGEVVCTAATKIAMDRAKKAGLATVGICNVGYVGRLGQYTEAVAENNMIGVLYCGVPSPMVAPWGGKTPVIGTNPLSFGMPTNGRPIVVDFATSAAAFGKVMSAFLRGETIPEGWIVNKEGNPTTDPRDYFTSEGEDTAGALLPAAGHKGYGLAIAVEILANVLTGSGYDGRLKTGNGIFLQVVNVESFIPLSDYFRRVDELVRRIKGSPKAAGFTEIMLPGEIEHRTAEKSRREGISVPDRTWKDVVRLADELKVNLKEIIT
jgi:LDH2 family malate/lactate/ureidoglycolate dehydrogenase